MSEVNLGPSGNRLPDPNSNRSKTKARIASAAQAEGPADSPKLIKSAEDVVCYGCGAAGHIKPNCPERDTSIKPKVLGALAKHPPPVAGLPTPVKSIKKINLTVATPKEPEKIERIFDHTAIADELHHEKCTMALCSDPAFENPVLVKALADSGSSVDTVSRQVFARLLSASDIDPNTLSDHDDRARLPTPIFYSVNRDISFGGQHQSTECQVVRVHLKLSLRGEPLLVPVDLTVFDVAGKDVVLSKQTLARHGLLSYIKDPDKWLANRRNETSDETTSDEEEEDFEGGDGAWFSAPVFDPDPPRTSHKVSLLTLAQEDKFLGGHVAPKKKRKSRGIRGRR